MPEFTPPSRDEYAHPDDPQEAITELLSSLDWSIARLTTEVAGLHGKDAVDLQRQVTERIGALTEIHRSLRMAAAS
jgi:hypothetical protein